MASLCGLYDCEEETIVEAIKDRFLQGQPYTHLGGIVVAVNPHEWLKLYGEDTRKAFLAGAGEGAHLYQTSGRAYASLSEARKNQCILISGVAGSGKTESAKLMQSSFVTSVGSKAHSARTQLFAVCTELLEAFGNAAVAGNDNSSRYGVVTELQFDGSDSPGPKLIGSLTRTFLLEKSRIVSHVPSDRSFHVFHYMLASEDEDFHTENQLLGVSANDFSYLQSEVPEFPSDEGGLAKVQAGLESLGVEKESQEALFSALAGVLYLGEVGFDAGSTRADGGCDVSYAATGSLSTAAGLLGIGEQELASVLLNRVIHIRGEAITQQNRPAEAQYTRDALAKSVYTRVFDFLVERINQATSAAAGDGLTGTISLIDIFGFESCDINGYEQLMINYASEKLQQRFVSDVFKELQKLCNREGINNDVITYRDNSAVLETLEGSQGVLSLLDETCRLPHGDDRGFAALVRKQLAGNDRIHSSTAGKQNTFTVEHYAHPVTYKVVGFVEKNRAQLHASIHGILAASTNTMVSTIGGGGAASASGATSPGAATASSAAADGSSFQSILKGFQSRRGSVGSSGEQAEPARGVARKRDSIGRAGGDKYGSVASTFCEELRDLDRSMAEADAQYVWCIRPNQDAKPKEFDEEYVTEQLRSASIIEAAKVYRLLGTPLTYEEFLLEFGTLAPEGYDQEVTPVADDAAATSSRCKGLASALLGESDFKMGTSRIFVSVSEVDRLRQVFVKRKQAAAREAAAAAAAKEAEAQAAAAAKEAEAQAAAAAAAKEAEAQAAAAAAAKEAEIQAEAAAKEAEIQAEAAAKEAEMQAEAAAKEAEVAEAAAKEAEAAAREAEVEAETAAATAKDAEAAAAAREAEAAAAAKEAEAAAAAKEAEAAAAAKEAEAAAAAKEAEVQAEAAAKEAEVQAASEAQAKAELEAEAKAAADKEAADAQAKAEQEGKNVHKGDDSDEGEPRRSPGTSPARKPKVDEEDAVKQSLSAATELATPERGEAAAEVPSNENKNKDKAVSIQDVDIKVPLEPFDVEQLRSFLCEPVPKEAGVFECHVLRKKSVVGSASFHVFFERTKRLLMIGRKDKNGKFVIQVNPAYQKPGSKSSVLGRVKAASARREYVIYNDGANPAKDKKNPPRKKLAVVGISITHFNEVQGPRNIEVVLRPGGELDRGGSEELEDNGSTSPVESWDEKKTILNSVQAEWDSEAGYFVLEFYQDRVKKQSVKNFMLQDGNGDFAMQFGRSDEENNFKLDIQGGSLISPVVAFGAALSSCSSNV
ncbi:unnamed protein product [Chrysoparadoxa australica]